MSLGKEASCIFHTQALPPQMEKLDIGKSQFSSNFTFHGLPETLENLNLRMNAFCGAIDLSKIPLSPKRRSLNDNQFCLPLTLPCKLGLKSQNMGRNSLTGIFDLICLPECIVEFSIIFGCLNSRYVNSTYFIFHWQKFSKNIFFS